MALKSFKPTTPGQRQLVLIDRSSLYKGPPVKSLTEGKHSTGGRNANGRIAQIRRYANLRDRDRHFEGGFAQGAADLGLLGLTDAVDEMRQLDGERLALLNGDLVDRD